MKKNLSKSVFRLVSRGFIFTALVCLLLSAGIKANNISIQKESITLTGQNTTNGYTMVQFNMSWENSWRVSTGPSNWDAAWVFVKYRVTVANGGDGLWHNANIDERTVAPPPNYSIKGAYDWTGAFIYRNADDPGSTFSLTGVQLKWYYSLNNKSGTTPIGDNDVVEVQVFAIEMVYVPQGQFALGSGGIETGAFYQQPNTTQPYWVRNEDAIQVGSSFDNLYYYTNNGLQGDQEGQIPAVFPKGYNAFYCMKYEISQQQYVDFLNTLTYDQQSVRTNIFPYHSAGTYLWGNVRNAIKISTAGTDNTTPAIYATDLPNVACNLLSWSDMAAYLDWSCLRPMTELEFEKACRGPNIPVANEYAWGNTYIIQNAGIKDEGAANETTSTIGANCTYGNNSAVFGPMRVGAFATQYSSRVTSGATYYGIMDMSGNLEEFLVTIGNPEGRAFTGIPGNGALNANGDADASYWPNSNGIGSGLRGGGWYSANTAWDQRVSDRRNASYAYAYRNISYGGRGVRKEP